MSQEPSLPREARLATTLVELADTLVEDFDVVELLTRLIHRCVEVLDVDAAGLMLIGPEGALRLAASSSEAMRVVELFELQSAEGPCLDCYRSGEPVVNQSLDNHESRWPNFVPFAAKAGFRSVHALPMRLRGQVIGALNLFRSGTGLLESADVVAGKALADMATIAILQHRTVVEAHLLNEQLGIALNSRILIEQAKGVLAERAGIDIEQSFTRLRAYARNHNLRLVDVAADVIAGTLTAAAFDQSNPRSP